MFGATAWGSGLYPLCSASSRGQPPWPLSGPVRTGAGPGPSAFASQATPCAAWSSSVGAPGTGDGDRPCRFPPPPRCSSGRRAWPFSHQATASARRRRGERFARRGDGAGRGHRARSGRRPRQTLRAEGGRSTPIAVLVEVARETVARADRECKDGADEERSACAGPRWERTRASCCPRPRARLLPAPSSPSSSPCQPAGPRRRRGPAPRSSSPWRPRRRRQRRSLHARRRLRSRCQRVGSTPSRS